MEVIVILLACSLGLVVMALLLFAYSVRQGDCDRSETLCLLPLEDDAQVPTGSGTEIPSKPPTREA